MYLDIKASSDLKNILNKINDKGLTRKVNGKLHKFFERIKALSVLTKFRITYINLTVEHFKDNINMDPTIPYLVKSRMLNIIIAKHRIEINKIINKIKNEKIYPSK